MVQRSPARLVAPIALVVVAVALVAVLASAGGGDPAPAVQAPAASPTATTGASRRRSTSSRSSRPRTYTVKAGDTPSSIAESTGVGVERLTELNPELDPQTLTVGQKVKLR